MLFVLFIHIFILILLIYYLTIILHLIGFKMFNPVSFNIIKALFIPFYYWQSKHWFWDQK